MTEMNESPGGEEMEPEAASVAGQGNRSDPLTEVTSVSGVLTFSSSGTSVDVNVDIPDNDPGMEGLSVSGSSSNTNPSQHTGDQLATSATRPSTGTLGRNGNSCDKDATYTVQLKFWYHGQNQRTVVATILTGSGSSSGSITLN